MKKTIYKIFGICENPRPVFHETFPDIAKALQEAEEDTILVVASGDVTDREIMEAVTVFCEDALTLSLVSISPITQPMKAACTMDSESHSVTAIFGIPALTEPQRTPLYFPDRRIQITLAGDFQKNRTFLYDQYMVGYLTESNEAAFSSRSSLADGTTA